MIILQQVSTYLSLYALENWFKTNDRSLDILIQTLVSGFVLYLVSISHNYVSSYDRLKYFIKDLLGHDQRFNFDPERIKWEKQYTFSMTTDDNCVEWVKSIKFNGQYIDDVRKIVANNDECGGSYLWPLYRYAYDKYTYMSIWSNRGEITSINLYSSDSKSLCLIKAMYDKHTYEGRTGLFIESYLVKDAYTTTTAKQGNISVKKIFDNLFFEGKEHFISLLDDFATKRLTTNRHLADNKFCVLLYGASGTGKTSIISATSNRLDMSVFIYDMSTLNKKITFANAIKYCIANRRILVLEEFDCLLKQMRSRKLAASDNDTNGSNSMMDVLCAKLATSKDPLDAKKIEEMIQKYEPSTMITLEVLLTEIDGIKSTDGLIIIATTNHPELIDDALKREFRLEPFECKIFNITLAKQLIRHLYYLDDDVELELNEKISIAPARLSKLCLVYKNYTDLIAFLNVEIVK